MFRTLSLQGFHHSDEACVAAVHVDSNGSPYLGVTEADSPQGLLEISRTISSREYYQVFQTVVQEMTTAFHDRRSFL